MTLKDSGFSLMEMLMVLLVIALITLSFFTLKQSETEVDKAEDLGYRLFEYGQALGDYLRTEGKNYDATEPTVLVYDGYQWLQEKGYLNNEFSLVVEPLYIDNIPGENTSMQTTILVNHTPGTTNEFELMLDMVQIGPVYSRNDVETDENGNKTAVQDVSLIARAVNYANEYRDNIKGSGVIQYRRVEVGTEPPAEPPVPGEPPVAPPPAFSTPSIIQGTTVDQSMWNDAWLLRSGNNTMQGPIQFETAIPEDSAINNVNRIKFRAEGLAAITDLSALNFAQGGGIGNVQNISFSISPGTIAAISDLDTIRFKGDPNLQSTIENLDRINFKNGDAFSGLKYLGYQDVIGKDGGGEHYVQIILDGKPVPIDGNFCFYEGVRTGDNSGLECRIERGRNGDQNHWVRMYTGKQTHCFIGCYSFK